MKHLIEGARRRMPRRWKAFFRPLYGLALDARDIFAGQAGKGLPPSRFMLPQYGGCGEAHYFEAGKRLARSVAAHAALRPEGRVLDVGCGTGRLAVGLADYLRPPGSYDGVDANAGYVRWAERNVAARFPRMRFHHADVFNAQYNAGGTVMADGCRLPFEDGFFDAVCFLSVFTHMRPADMEAYLREASRVLKPGGRVYASYYLLDDEARSPRGAPELAPALDFRCDFGLYRSISADTPEYSVAHDAAHVRALHARFGLAVREPVFMGSWRGCAAPEFQDVVVSSKGGDS